MVEVEHTRHDGEKKCGICGFRYVSHYRMAGDDFTYCGDCLATIIVEDGHEIATRNESIIRGGQVDSLGDAIAHIENGDTEAALNGLRAILNDLEEPDADRQAREAEQSNSQAEA